MDGNQSTSDGVADLGALVSEHRGTFGQGGTAWLLGGVLSMYTVLGPIGAVWTLVTEGPHAAMFATWGSIAAVVIVPMLGPLILALPILRWRQTARVYERGLWHRSLLGTTVIRAHEAGRVVHTRIRRKFSTLDEIEIRRRGQRSLFITGIADADRLVAIVRAWSQQASAPVPGTPMPVAGGWVPPGQT
jgi:hypothetical protein